MSRTLYSMSFNLRFDCSGDGPYQFSAGRYLYDTEFIRRAGPDVICFQELTFPMLNLLKSGLSDLYGFFFYGRNNDLNGEGAGIAYRKDRFQPLHRDIFWLSSMPGVAGSTMEETIPRTCTVTELIGIHGSAPAFRVYSTHLHHARNEQLRTDQLRMILERIRRDNAFLPLPFILAGDFNTCGDTETIAQVKRDFSDLGIYEATEGIGTTFHSFGKPDYTPIKIDYIFTDLPLVPGSARRITERRESDGMFLSDHNPIEAVLRFD